MNEIKYPARINKYLAHKNICSRREADKLIEEGKILINGKPAKLGDKVNENDSVTTKADPKEGHVYLAFNKPKDVITHSPQGEEISINEVISFSKKVFPVGRLDKDSHGLIILTNDGRVTGKLLSPEHDHEKEYVVRVDKPIDARFVRKMASGVVLDDGQRTKECKVSKMSTNVFSIILTEGKNRQIRRMCGFFGYAVTDLRRTRIMNIEMGGLKVGQYRKIKGEELKTFLSELGL
ncbi:MAG TPA: 23S rRNA pseudouridine synthase F [Candidatus Moranbacteria bacterium]|nr:MAG: Pseudouridine synthase [Candidatus Moranbacteria bacterium GW2011_GWC2_45_10]KKT95041.1 MAG: ribosomal large subunit pseudouridine synthase F, ribosomal large subunit pseudouridine synthase F [Parcubacteria group bacterium GW2011_GWC1_45_14]HAV11509.1 23S rRNA pseudouridine synthase F [Candidatus Moranbacteria bacterium]